MRDELLRIYEIIKLAEKLKLEMRHSWLSNGRQESVADHSWRVALMAVLVAPYLKKDLDLEKLLKMTITHDLVEAKAGDVPAFEAMGDAEIKKLKHEKEAQAIEDIRSTLGGDIGDELFSLWDEMESRSSYEAKVANALDKLEVQVQHNEAPIDTWLDIEKKMIYMMDKHVEFDNTMAALKDIILEEAEEKLLKNGIDLDTLKA